MRESTEMELRVAKALIDRIGSPWPWNKMDQMIREMWIDHARAAIRAMHKATPAMWDAGAEAHQQYKRMTKDDDFLDCESLCNCIYQDMIDVASPEEAE